MLGITKQPSTQQSRLNRSYDKCDLNNIDKIETFQGSQCCADDPISFHYMSEERMYELDYLIHRVGQNLATSSYRSRP